MHSLQRCWGFDIVLEVLLKSLQYNEGGGRSNDGVFPSELKEIIRVDRERRSARRRRERRREGGRGWSDPTSRMMSLFEGISGKRESSSIRLCAQNRATMLFPSPSPDPPSPPLAVVEERWYCTWWITRTP